MDELIVLHDELDLAPRRVKVKIGGGAAGHNGLRSIAQHFGSEYTRVRLGIGHPGHKDQVTPYVLGDFAKTDRVWLADLLDAVAIELPWVLKGDSERFMTEVARRTGGKRLGLRDHDGAAARHIQRLGEAHDATLGVAVRPGRAHCVNDLGSRVDDPISRDARA